MLKIEITAADKAEYDCALAALGLVRQEAISYRTARLVTSEDAERFGLRAAECDDAAVSEVEIPSTAAEITGTGLKATVNLPGLFPSPTGPRKAGFPAPGRKRRSSEEVAQDDAYFASINSSTIEAVAAEQNQEPEDGAGVAGESLFGDAETEAPLISSGEERLDPEQSAEEAAQDAADEAAEFDNPLGEANLTHDDLRAVIGDYAKIVGVAAASKNVKAILGCGIVEVPKTNEALGAAIEKVKAAIASQEKTEDKPKVVSRADVMAALRGYAEKYDGTADFKAAINAKIDGTAIVTEIAGVGLSKAPDTPEMNAKLYHAIVAATAANRFGRKAVK
ncbi:MAG TPA: hypothetical protein VMJ73_12210 [Rhizomicrobium sp.]|nr:hypothetical protein [Rhizomicrobium sp.]